MNDIINDTENDLGNDFDSSVEGSSLEEPAIEATIAEAVTSVPGVAGLSAGAFADVATYLPSGRLIGVRRWRGRTDIAIVLRWGANAQTTAARVRSRIRAVVAGPIDITIADITTPETSDLP